MQRAALKLMVGDMERYGLPKPDHKLFEAHPTVSDDILSRIAHGEVTPKPNIAELTETTVRFADGTEVEADVVVYCTGYKVTFPFFDPAVIAAPDNDLPLFRRTFHPDIRSVFFIGLLQPLGAIMPIAETQSAWLCDHLAGPLPAAAAGRAARRRRGRARGDVQALREVQAPHDAGRLRRLDARHPARAGGGRRAGARGREPAAAAAARGGARVTVAIGRRERTKAANRAAILRAALEAFGELGYEGVAVRDIVRRTELASGTFYNYFPDKDAVFDALIADAAASARRRVQEARAGARDRAELIERGFRAYFEWVVEDPVRFAFLRRNLARGIAEALPAGVRELAADLARHEAGRGGPRLPRARDGRRRRRARRAHGRARAARRRGRDALRDRAVRQAGVIPSAAAPGVAASAAAASVSEASIAATAGGWRSASGSTTSTMRPGSAGHGADGDVVAAHRGERERGQERDAEAARDERLHGHVVVGRVGDRRLEARLARDVEEVAAAALAARDPRLAVEVGEVERAVAGGERVAGREHGERRVAQQRARLQVAPVAAPRPPCRRSRRRGRARPRAAAGARPRARPRRTRPRRPGAARAARSSAPAISVALAEGNAASRTRPARRPAIAATSSSASARRASTASACSTSARPASVSCTPRPRRVSTAVPTSSSSRAMWCDTAGCV